MAYDFKNITVLVVDSQPALLDLIHGVLHMLGVRKIIIKQDGQSGLEAYQAYRPDLMIIDWDLHNLNGLDFTRAVRNSTEPFTPIIFMTAFSSQKRVLEARDSGITEFLRKPFTAQSLYKRIEEIIERPRKFVRTEEFFGPDRRRHKRESFMGDEKREMDPIEIDLIDRS